jgi:hypothetical protein
MRSSGFFPLVYFILPKFSIMICFLHSRNQLDRFNDLTVLRIRTGFGVKKEA